MTAIKRYERAVRRFMICEKDSAEWDRLLDRIEAIADECSREEMDRVDQRVAGDPELQAKVELMATARRSHRWRWSHARNRYECCRCDATGADKSYQLPEVGCSGRQTVAIPRAVVPFRPRS